MFGIKLGLRASIIVIFLGFSIQVHAETGLTSKEFLTWNESNRRSYIQVAMMSMNMISLENDKSQSDCIGDWYAADRRGGEEYIYEIMKKAPDYHPIGVIMAVLEKKCGPFKYR
ncbi:hypothetical protein [Stappia stellulata]|uniref:hypothetical protein n=1 Tax=Stappia stellulata TaxID=71235 RepID=UPI00055ACDAE|nr:hypothetical protein [Stappia stellulata]